MKREMKSNFFKIIILCITVIFLSSCSFFQKKETSVVTPEEVYTAIILDDSYTLNRYLSEGFPIDYRDPSGETLLMKVLKNNSLKSLDILITRGVDLDWRDDFGKSGVFYVRSIESLEKIVENGANLNIITSENQTSLLTYFIKYKPLNYSIYLIESGANPLIKDVNGWDSTFWAVINGDYKIIETMRENGVNFLESDRKGNYPIYYALDERNILELLKISGYDLKKKNIQGENILGEVYLRAVANGYISVVEKLLKLGVNSNYTSYGDSAISIAEKNKNQEMIKFLNSNNIK